MKEPHLYIASPTFIREAQHISTNYSTEQPNDLIVRQLRFMLCQPLEKRGIELVLIGGESVYGYLTKLESKYAFLQLNHTTSSVPLSQILRLKRM